MAVRHGAHVSGWYAVTAYNLGMEHERPGILHQHLDEAASERAPSSVSEHRFLADEAAWFLEIERKTEARFVRHIGIVDVVAVVAVALFHAQTGQRLESGVYEAEFASRLDEAVVDMYRLLGGNVELVAELAQIGDANAEYACETDVDLARAAERECSVREIRGRELLQERT